MQGDQARSPLLLPCRDDPNQDVRPGLSHLKLSGMTGPVDETLPAGDAVLNGDHPPLK